jgi:HPt (histidine-containing phosphotransfer) domain-containing protein
VPKQEFLELIEAFLGTLPGQVERIEALAGEGELAALGRELHDLASTSGNFGASHVEHLARRLELACRNNEREQLSELVPALRETAQSALAAVRSRLPALEA